MAYGDIEFMRRHADQAYYWTRQWQTDEAESFRELAAGNYRTFTNVEDALAWLAEEDN